MTAHIIVNIALVFMVILILSCSMSYLVSLVLRRFSPDPTGRIEPLILDILERSDGPLTGNQIYSEIQNEEPNSTLAQILNILYELVHEEIIKKRRTKPEQFSYNPTKART